MTKTNKESSKNSKKAAAKKANADSTATKATEDTDAPAKNAAEATDTKDKNKQTVDADTADTGTDSSDPLAAYTMEELRDLYLRALADKENILRRAEIEIKKARDFALDKFAPGICDVCDCLQVALSDTPAEGNDSDKKIHEGIALTLRKLSTVMEANGLRTINPDAGASFDPTLHQAIGVDSSGKHAVNTVTIVVQLGYTLNGRVVRPANVIISKLGEEKPPTA